MRDVTLVKEFKKIEKALDQLEANDRYTFSAFVALGLVQRVEGEKGPQSFVDPSTFSHLPILKAGLWKRLRWLLTGKV